RRSAADELWDLLGRRRRRCRLAGRRSRCPAARCVPCSRVGCVGETSPSGPATGAGGHVSRIRAFGWFWWDFVVGADRRVAGGLAVGLGLTWLVEHLNISAWWLLPLAVACVLTASVYREARRTRAAD